MAKQMIDTPNLDELEKEGKIEQVGEAGHAVTYRPKQHSNILENIGMLLSFLFSVYRSAALPHSFDFRSRELRPAQNANGG